ncbi:MAG: hypothetical protein HY565_02370 [Candidatus Kerfeldbacteria bacterium]|nr:hypothetical protein [Candidatus Kerfeldbacteria bacterium]
MRWSKWLLIVAFITAVPFGVQAQTSGDDIIAGATGDDPATTTSGPSDGVDFDIGDNVFGNPNDGETLSKYNVDPKAKTFDSLGSIERLTFLSGGSDPVTIAINIINLSLSFLLLLCIIFILYAGFKWFTARDNEEEAKKAKDIIVGAVIGLIIVLSSMGIAQLVFNNTVSQTTVQTSWLDMVVSPAYADEVEPIPQALPFDPAQADPSTTGLGRIVLGSIGVLDLGSADPVTIVLAVVNGLLTLLAFVFLILLLYAGVLWATARGNEEQITKAKSTLKRSVIGLVIILSAYGITWIVSASIYYATIV